MLIMNSVVRKFMLFLGILIENCFVLLLGNVFIIVFIVGKLDCML